MIRTFRDTSEELAFPLFSRAKTTLDPSGLDFLTLQNGLWDDVTIPFIDTNLNAPHTRRLLATCSIPFSIHGSSVKIQ